jgi:integrase/recombinase XerD
LVGHAARTKEETVATHNGHEDPQTRALDGTVASVLELYRLYLMNERGLAAESVRCYLLDARVFLAQLPGPSGPVLEGLSAGQVTGFFVDYCRDRNVWSAKAMVTGVRSFLRFLHVAGFVPASLTGAVPAVASWRGASLPRGLTAAQVQAMLTSCDLVTVVGRRDRAVLMLLARLGLRTVEVATLSLDDVDWRSGRLSIRGKGNRVESLPLPVEVGAAVVDYLTSSRPRTVDRALFVRVRRPHRALTAMAVRQIVARACARAGLPRLAAHRLRHTLATDMLRAGTPLAQVAQVLRHRNQLSTTVYAKVDHAALAALARPWPGGAR